MNEAFFNAHADLTADRLVYEEVDPTLGMVNQTKGALQNMLIDAYTAVLTNPKLNY